MVSFVEAHIVSFVLLAVGLSALSLVFVAVLLVRVHVLYQHFYRLTDLVKSLSAAGTFFTHRLVSVEATAEATRRSLLTLDAEVNPGAADARPCRCVYCRMSAAASSESVSESKDQTEVKADAKDQG